MSVTLPPELEATIQEKIERGGYDDAAAVVREALRLLEERDRLTHLRALIAEAEAEVARGEVVDWTPNFMERLIRESEEDARNGVPIPDEVKP